ncbi:hypothetical protein A2914_00245 [Candidatus Nomurabacteria bacterium RIFCSPLOWO2_01_FULL_41_21]|uniref:Uncharacterized protein n=2 Tax=Candidatus Nomuraibacteriota TaxID=1752729 RepID=A0A1F6V3V9_9BACT|nr:MAG: hypothetical protein A2733_02650 [Candidatus Nomurabacteria bacterium RIFCSPHIGHO2_01_FULL_40_20]OGI88786.1 MAG: hypothetical protein A2914_00245 [Candidatus Nomurabacteria bacterium RIFCSPLOWO2_01_FULL_41_21]
MNIFQKGNYRIVPSDFRTLGITALVDLNKFQDKFGNYDTDTAINEIRDAIIANYFGFDLLNFAKHGFDAKKSRKEEFLEVKQCSISSKRYGGTWNDTNIEKAKAFSDKRLFTAIAVWKGASDLQFVIYGQNKDLGKYLLDRVKNRKPGSRSTQNVNIETLIKKYKFSIVCPPDKTKEYVSTILVGYKKHLSKYSKVGNIKTIEEV